MTLADRKIGQGFLGKSQSGDRFLPAAALVILTSLLPDF
jgi:hypothetical protein